VRTELNSLRAVVARSFGRSHAQERRAVKIGWIPRMAKEHSLPSRSIVSLDEFQQLIRTMYFDKDAARGVDGTFMWLMEEVGELAAALREGSHEDKMEEFADVLAWLTTIANVAGVDLTEAITRKYGAGCPGCGKFACLCADSGKP
jgi:NTP pyrophosphatase (non-canonical NTP hydrolase)